MVKRLDFKEWVNDIANYSKFASKLEGKWILDKTLLLEFIWNLQLQVWDLEERLTKQSQGPRNLRVPSEAKNKREK